MGSPLQKTKLQMMCYRVVRASILAFVHLAVWVVTLQGASWFFGGRYLLQQVGIASARILLLFLSIKVLCALLGGSFRELWYRASMEDLRALLRNTLLTTSILFLVLLCAPALGIHPGVTLLDGAFSLMALASLRVLLQVLREGFVRRRPVRTVILAGRQAFVELEFRRMRLRPTGDRPIGLVLEDLETPGALLRRVPVLNRAQVERLLRDHTAEAIIVVPPVSAPFHCAMEELCHATHTMCQPVTSPHALSELVETASAELLHRPPIQIDLRPVGACISGRRVMVTGGGGSIGSELARQLLLLGPAQLLLLDRSENALFNVERDLQARSRGIPVHTEIVDVRDEDAVRRRFLEYRPEIVFHAAAHKHVPLMERHPCEAFLNNVGGTRIVADAADAAGTQTFVFISTDKAVEPSSIMGVTKRLGEMYIRCLAETSRTCFAAVRFGNVLGSSGSVVPIFIDQIKRGQPITVTHPEMSRYFMSIPEACQLVLEACALATGGEIFVLDMGDPVKIVDLARRLIERAGLRPGDDVPIVYSGTRPGEKLSEQLLCAEEFAQKTSAPGIWLVATEGDRHGIGKPLRAELVHALAVLSQHALAGDRAQVVRMMADLVPEYQPQDLYLRHILSSPAPETRYSARKTAVL